MKQNIIKYLQIAFPFLITIALWRLSNPWINPAGVLAMIPIFYCSGVGMYFAVDLVAISFSALSFIYFVSFFCRREDEGAKVLFVFVFGFLITISGLIFVYRSKIMNYFGGFRKLYRIHILD